MRVGSIAAQEGWCEEYSRATFREWFIGQRPPGVDDHVERILASLDKAPASIIGRANSIEGEDLLNEATHSARELGIFGAPTFAVGRELFWGDDRLGDAIEFATGH